MARRTKTAMRNLTETAPAMTRSRSTQSPIPPGGPNAFAVIRTVHASATHLQPRCSLCLGLVEDDARRREGLPHLRQWAEEDMSQARCTDATARILAPRCDRPSRRTR